MSFGTVKNKNKSQNDSILDNVLKDIDASNKFKILYKKVCNATKSLGVIPSADIQRDSFVGGLSFLYINLKKIYFNKLKKDSGFEDFFNIIVTCKIYDCLQNGSDYRFYISLCNYTPRWHSSFRGYNNYNSVNILDSDFIYMLYNDLIGRLEYINYIFNKEIGSEIKVKFLPIDILQITHDHKTSDFLKHILEVSADILDNVINNTSNSITINDINDLVDSIIDSFNTIENSYFLKLDMTNLLLSVDTIDLSLKTDFDNLKYVKENFLDDKNDIFYVKQKLHLNYPCLYIGTMIHDIIKDNDDKINLSIDTTLQSLQYFYSMMDDDYIKITDYSNNYPKENSIIRLDSLRSLLDISVNDIYRRGNKLYYDDDSNDFNATLNKVFYRQTKNNNSYTRLICALLPLMSLFTKINIGTTNKMAKICVSNKTPLDYSIEKNIYNGSIYFKCDVSDLEKQKFNIYTVDEIEDPKLRIDSKNYRTTYKTDINDIENIQNIYPIIIKCIKEELKNDNSIFNFESEDHQQNQNRYCTVRLHYRQYDDVDKAIVLMIYIYPVDFNMHGPHCDKYIGYAYNVYDKNIKRYLYEI